MKYIYDNDELKVKIYERNIERKAIIIDYYLQNYEHMVEKYNINRSNKDLIYWIINYKTSLEDLCSSKYINGKLDDEYIFDKIINCYYNTKKTILNYEGETSGPEDQTLTKAISILLKNPYLNEEIKKSQLYIENLDNNSDNQDNNQNDYYDDNESDVGSIDEYNIDLSDIEYENSEEEYDEYSE
jgi:hypothetical protein